MDRQFTGGAGRQLLPWPEERIKKYLHSDEDASQSIKAPSSPRRRGHGIVQTVQQECIVFSKMSSSVKWLDKSFQLRLLFSLIAASLLSR